MKLFFNAMLTMIAGSLVAESMDLTKNAQPPFSDPAIYLKYEDYKWEKLIPELGNLSAEMTILHVSPKTGATQLMIRCPKNYHAPKHWHTANETHYCVYGHFLMKDADGKTADLSPGSYNYMPSKMIHEGWTTLRKVTFFTSQWMALGTLISLLDHRHLNRCMICRRDLYFPNHQNHLYTLLPTK